MSSFFCNSPSEHPVDPGASRWDYEIQDHACAASLLRLSAFLRLYLPVTLLSELQLPLEAALQKQVPYHCTYEKRRRRKNFVEKLELT
jgi:hypothetical protein